MEIILRAPVVTPSPSARLPGGAPTPDEVLAVHDELLAYHAVFALHFRRAEQRHWALKYTEGQLLPLERKSIESIAEALDGGNAQAMQQFVGLGGWDDDVVLATPQRLVAETLDDPATGVLIGDGCDFPKQGEHSVGAARQYCEALGKVANCQASVVVWYASAWGHMLVDRRLYVHEDWFADTYADRRTRCGVPADLAFQTCTELTWAMIAGLRERGDLPFGWVTGDEHFGNTPVLLDRIADAGLAYFMEVPHNVRVWAARHPTAIPAATGKKGHPFTRLRIAPGCPHPGADGRAGGRLAIRGLASEADPGGEQGVAGRGGCLRARRRIRDGLPGPDVWVVFRRALAAGRELRAYLCNAAADTPPETLVWLLGLRWPIEQTIKEAKEGLGLDHYEVRGWRGWHHHTTMALLAQHFLVRLRGRLGENTPALTVPQVRRLLSLTLPAQRRDAGAMFAFIEEVQRRNYAAARSHYQRRLRLLQRQIPREPSHVVKLGGTTAPRSGRRRPPESGGKEFKEDVDSQSKRSAIVVSSYPGQASCAELEHLAVVGERPRKDYVELARALDADVIDSHYLAGRAAPLARMVARRAGLPAGQIAEAFWRRGRYHHIVAWSDRVGLPLALLYKLARSRRDLVLISAWLSRAKKAAFLQHFKVYSHLRAIVNYSSAQMEIAANRLGVPRQKLHLALQPVDDRFWRPHNGTTESLICSVGWEARDYSTLVKAARGLEMGVELAIGTIVMPSSAAASGPIGARMRMIVGEGVPANVRLSQLNPQELRHLYSRSRFVVIPLRDVEVDAGVTALAEAMAMGKAVVVTRTRGQVDLIRDGEQGIYVPPGNPAALRTAIEYLASHPREAERMGRAGRALVEERHRLDDYTSRLAALVREPDERATGIAAAQRAEAPLERRHGPAVPDGPHC